MSIVLSQSDSIANKTLQKLVQETTELLKLSMVQGMNASMKKGPANQLGGAFFCFKRLPYSAFASGALSPWDRL